MARLARVLVVALITVFAVWTVAQVASATTMSLEMAAMTVDEHGAMDMVDCEACASGQMGDQANLTCDLACVSPALADLVTSQSFSSAPVASYAGWSVFDLAGRTYPPDPHPPRAFLLI